ncbi:MAG: S8 family serine peptidase, partial [Myxococcota bacterium]
MTVAREPGRSGYALLRGEPERLAALVRDERVAASQPHAVTSGSGNVRTFEGQLEHLQWYIDQVDPPESYGWYGNWIATYPARTFVVAVLDTGVAYETATRDGVDYVAVPSLAASPIVAPYDFVNDDPHANDDHQHGTHIASLISASHAVSELHGISPEAGIMPVKVLDEHNQGVELDLIEGIWHAVANQADVINMSLSFSEGYHPSPALQEAIQAAHDAGIVMIGAAGNDGSDFVTWPAASPHVMAIGSSTAVPWSEGDFEMQAPAGYTNLSAGIDL